MDGTRKGQKWVLDAFIGAGGMGVLHPESNYFREELGYNSYDLKKTFDRAKSSQMMSAAWAWMAKEIEGRALYWQARGSKRAAKTLFERAMLLYGRTHYSIQNDMVRRRKYLEKVLGCQRQVSAAAHQRMENVPLSFEGKQVFGLFEAGKDVKKAPCVILLSGMDMFKENWHKFMENEILPRGWCGFAIDGPGQGEALTNGVTMTLDNYERAISRAIDWLVEQPEVDPNKIVIMGSSMGSWWGTRAIAQDTRIKAFAINMPCLGPKTILLDQAQPSFVNNLMFMTGLKTYEEIAAFAETMSLDELAHRVTIPTLVVTGENDELTTLEATIGIYEKFQGPKEMWVYQHEFHPIGPPANEWLSASLDWLEMALEGKFTGKSRRQVFITKEGEYLEGAGTPPWWDPV